MDIRKYIILGVCTLLGVTSWAQNTLNAPATLESKAGNSISVPISMENSEDVVAVQFDVQLPFSMTSGQKPTLNESRSKGHSIATRYLGSNKFTILITNLENKALAGTAGTLVNIPMTISTDAQVNVDYPITLSNVVFSETFAEEEEIAMLSTLASKLSSTGYKMALASSGTSNASISLTVPAETSALTAAISWMEHLTLTKVNLTLNGAKIYPEQMAFETSQTACSNTSTTAVDFTAFGDNQVTAEWYASVSASCQLTGYQTVGGNVLPAMQISNPGNTTD